MAWTGKPRVNQYEFSRRDALMLAGAAALLPGAVAATAGAMRIKWSDLIPGDLPYAEIIGRGEINAELDIWRPEFDANGSQFNTELDGQRITLAGYVLPLELTADGVTEFVLVPYVGACIHTPPPPPNQLMFVTTEVPWPNGNLWDAVLVTGPLGVQPVETEVANIGYQMQAEYIEPYSR